MSNIPNYSKSGRKPKKRQLISQVSQNSNTNQTPSNNNYQLYQSQQSTDSNNSQSNFFINTQPNSTLSSQEYNPQQQYRFINVLPSSSTNNLDISTGTTPDRGPPAQFKSSKKTKSKKSDDGSFIKRKRLKAETKADKNVRWLNKFIGKFKTLETKLTEH